MYIVQDINCTKVMIKNVSPNPIKIAKAIKIMYDVSMLCFIYLKF